MKKNLSNSIVTHIKKDIEFIQYKPLQLYSDKLIHCVSTRVGGIGNSCIKHSEPSENTQENFKALSNVLNIDYRNLVFSNQIHEDTIRIVDQSNCGEGILRSRTVEGCDALITASPETALVTFFADCVSVMFYDPIKNVIASSHAGWRGTVKKICQKTTLKMKNEFDCNLKDIIACIGPSIGPCCFEVNLPVVAQFQSAFENWQELISKNTSGKYQIDLWKANQVQLLEIGLKKENVHISNLCTSCNKDIFYSYRAENGDTGRIYAVIQIK